MKLKIALVVLVLALVGLVTNSTPRPVMVDCTMEDGRRYFVTYEVKRGEDRESVKDQVSCSL
jgi:hypothetical protein